VLKNVSENAYRPAYIVRLCTSVSFQSSHATSANRESAPRLLSPIHHLRQEVHHLRQEPPRNHGSGRAKMCDVPPYLMGERVGSYYVIDGLRFLVAQEAVLCRV
jgi:hypothetical protein